MWGTCKLLNFSPLLFATLTIGQNLLTQKAPFQRPFRRFMHSLCKNESIPLWRKEIAT